MAIDFERFAREDSKSDSINTSVDNSFSRFERKKPSNFEQMQQSIQSGVPPLVSAIQSTGRRIINQNTPGELVNEGFSPNQAAIMSTAQKMISPVISAGNAMLGGLPDVFMKYLGEQRNKPKDIKLGGINIAPAVDIGANVYGFTKGPLALGGALAKGIKGVGAGSSALRGAIQFGLASGLNTPENEFNNIKGRVLRTGAGAAGGAVFGAVSNRISALRSVVNKEIELAKSFRGSIKTAAKSNSSKFENSLYDITLKNNLKKVDLSKDLDLSKFNRETKKTIDFIYKRSENFKNIVNNPKEVSLKQIQDASNEVKGILSSSKLRGTGLRNKDVGIKNVIEKIKDIKYREFPEMKVVDDAYGQMADNLKIYNSLKKGNTISAIKNTFKDKEKVDALSKIAGTELTKDLKDYVLSDKLIRSGIGITETLIKYGIIYNALQRGVRSGLFGSQEYGQGE